LPEPGELEGIQQISTKRDKSDSPSLFSFVLEVVAIYHRLHDTVMTPNEPQGCSPPLPDTSMDSRASGFVLVGKQEVRAEQRVVQEG
jgi:hypothetical protein